MQPPISGNPLHFGPVSCFSEELTRAFWFATLPEIYTLRVLAWSLPSNPVIVNIGAGAGTSSLAFSESRPDAKIFTVDICEGGPFGGLENERNAFNGTNLTVRPIQILGDSKEIGRVWQEKNLHPKTQPAMYLDLCYIDGDHSYKGCLGDLLAWKDCVKPGGLLVFHDYTRKEWPDVKKVIDEAFGEEKWLEGWEPFLVVDTLFVARKL